MKLAVALLLLVPVAAACSPGASDPSAELAAHPDRPIALGEWCKEMIRSTCTNMGDRCVGSSEVTNGCMDTGVESCLGGRDPATPSGHKAKDLRSCIGVANRAPCDGYLVEISSHSECQAAASASP